MCRSCGTLFGEASGPECLCGSGSLWLPPVERSDPACESKAKAMLLSRFSELAEYRSVPWTILAHYIAVVWRWLSQVRGGSGRWCMMCPSVPIVTGGEVLILWAPRPRGPLSLVPPRPTGHYQPTDSGWELQPPALSLPSQWAYGPACSRCGRLRGYSVTLYSRTDSPPTPATLWRRIAVSELDFFISMAFSLSLRPVGRPVSRRTSLAPPRGRLRPWTSCGGPTAHPPPPPLGSHPMSSPILSPWV